MHRCTIFNYINFIAVPEFIRTRRIKEHMWDSFSMAKLLPLMANYGTSFLRTLKVHKDKPMKLQEIEGIMMDLMVSLLVGSELLSMFLLFASYENN